VITEVSAVTFRQNLGEMLNKVQYRNDNLVITKDGKPVAALVDARMFERLQRMQARFDALCERIEQGFAQVPEEDGIKEINAALTSERRKAKARTAKG
jgi:prevent-host-death family protein